jgi:hypothetical protein
MGDFDPDSEDEVILLLGTPSICADPDLETDFTQALKGRRRVIWIWPKRQRYLSRPQSTVIPSFPGIP